MLIDLKLTRDEFMSTFHEKRWFVTRRAFDMPFVNWRDIDRCLYAWDPSDGLMRLYLDGQIGMENFTESFLDVGLRRTRVVKEPFYRLLRDGATLVLNRLDTKLEEVHLLAMAIGRFVGEKAVANGYVAFGGKGTFEKHWDTHDVFAVQLIGRKHWRVFAPTFHFPFPHQTSRDVKDQCPEQPVFDGVLEQGDILYIPRGWWHEATPLPGQETLHAAVGIHPPLLSEYVMWACHHLIPESESARVALRTPDPHEDLASPLNAACAALRAEEGMRRYKRDIISGERVVTPFRLADVADASRVPADLAFASSYGIDADGVFHSNGTRVRLDEKSRSAIAAPASALHEAAETSAQLRFKQTLMATDVCVERRVTVKDT